MTALLSGVLHLLSMNNDDIDCVRIGELERWNEKKICPLTINYIHLLCRYQNIFFLFLANIRVLERFHAAL